MSKITDELDAAGLTVDVPDDFESLIAATDAEGARAAAAALGEGLSAREAAARAVATESAVGSRELFWSFEKRELAGFVGGETVASREGSYRGHSVFVLDSEVGVDLLQALAMLDELPLTDLGEASRDARIEETVRKVREDSASGRSADERLDFDHIEALLDRAPPAEGSLEGVARAGRQAAVVDARGDVVVHRAAEGSSPLFVLRGGHPFLALGIDGDPLRAPLRFLVALVDLSLGLEEAAERTGSVGAVAVMVDDEFGRHALGETAGITSGQS